MIKKDFDEEVQKIESAKDYIEQCTYIKDGEEAEDFMEDKHEEACTNCKYLDACMKYCNDLE